MTKQKKIIIIGAGQNGSVVANILSYHQDNNVVGFLDDNVNKERDILGAISDYKKYNKNSYYFFVSIGDNLLRKKIYEKLKKDDCRFINVIHPTAFIEKDVVLGSNVMIGALSYINIHSTVGDGTIINNGCVVEHDNIIGNYCHLAPGVITAGEVTINDLVFIGIGSTVRDRSKIAENCFIGSNSNVVKDTKPNSVYYGNPVKFIKKV